MRPSPDSAGSVAGASGSAPTVLWASSVRGCMRRLSACAGAVKSATAATAAGRARRRMRLVAMPPLVSAGRPPGLASPSGLTHWRRMSAGAPVEERPPEPLAAPPPRRAAPLGPAAPPRPGGENPLVFAAPAAGRGAGPAAPAPGRAASLVRAARPRQWVKNLLVFAAPAAGGVLGHGDVVWSAIGAFVAFCLVSSATYMLNDLVDAEADRRHPVKRFRPI